MMKLNEVQTLKLVQLYREHMCLWDITSEFYKNKHMRQSALQEISMHMNIEGFTAMHVKSKIKSIRSTYYLELDKIEKSTMPGSIGNIYQPKAKWFAEFDSFIRNVIVKRKMRENTEPGDRDYEDQIYTLENFTPQPRPSTPETYTPQPRPFTPETYTPLPHPCTPEIYTPQPRPSTPETSTTRPRKKSKLTQLSSIIDNMKEFKNNFSMSEREDDEFDIFGKYIATQLRQLSTEQAILGQEEIQQVITKRRLNDLKYNDIIIHAPGANTHSMSSTSTVGSQNTNASLNLLCEVTEYPNTVVNTLNNA